MKSVSNTDTEKTNCISNISNNKAIIMTSTTAYVAKQLKRYVGNLANKARCAKKLKEKDDKVVNLTQQVAATDGELAAKDRVINAKNGQLTTKNDELKTKDTTIAALENDVQKLKAEFVKCKNSWEEKGRSDAAKISSLEAQIGRRRHRAHEHATTTTDNRRNGSNNPEEERSLSGISVEDGTILCSPPVSLDNTENANGDDADHHHHHNHHHHRHHEEGSVSAESNTCSTPSEGGVRYSIVIHTKELGLNIDPTTGIIYDVTNEEYLSAKFISASEIIIHGDKVVQIGNTQLFDGNTVVYVPDIIANNTQRPITIVIERDPTLYRFVDGPFYNRGIDNDDMDHRFNRSDVGMDNNDDTITLPTPEENHSPTTSK